jgi:uncharacterized protein YjfI (DUF2170 family)|tara:strand:+ start:637 stop:927 length:291 start_codon:yes stop_codon:yes gene_type:complete
MKIDLNEYAEGAVLLDGFENSIIGIIEEFGNGPRILYSKSLIIDTLMKDKMTYEEAEEFYEFNILGLYANEQNVVFLTHSLKPKKKKKNWSYKIKK